MSETLSAETTIAVGTDETDSVWEYVTVGEFVPLEVFYVRFVVHEELLPIFPPQSTVHGTISLNGPSLAPIHVFNLGPEHPHQTVKVGGVPGGYSGTMELSLLDKENIFTLTYALKQALPKPVIKTGKYVFQWGI